MKNFPDQDPFRELENRLEAYTEQPDELVWKNIDAALRPNRSPLWAPWMDRATIVASILLFGLGIVAMESRGTLHHNQVEATNKGTISSAEGEPFLPSESSSVPRTSMPLRTLDGNSDDLDVVRRAATQVSVKRVDEEEIVYEVTEALQTSEFNAKAHLSDSPRRDEKIVGINSTPIDSAVDSPVLQRLDSSVAKDITGVKEPTRIPKRSPAFYFTTTPMLSFQRIIPVSRDGVVVSEISDRPIFSAERFGINIDVGIQGFLTKRFEYFAGISMYQQRQTLRYTYQTDEDLTADSKGENKFVITPNTSQATITYEMLNAGIQGGILYHLSGKLLTHKLGAGILFQQGLKKTEGEAYNNGGSSYLSYQIFYRNELRLNPRLRLFIQPTFVQSVHANEKLNAPFNIKPYRAGLGFGVLYDFQKPGVSHKYRTNRYGGRGFGSSSKRIH